MKEIKGFSKLSKKAKLEWLIDAYFDGDQSILPRLQSYWHIESDIQKLHDEFIENTITNYFLPLGIAPNFKINDSVYCIPMAIEESSVVAAAAKAAKYWGERGGFKTEILGEEKIGQIHFIYTGDTQKLQQFISEIKPQLQIDVASITRNMEKRGGDIQ